jgi:RNA polymerase sigma factor (sigma-70 family)
VKDFGEQILEHRRALLSIAIGLTKNVTSAEDLVQDTIVRGLSSAAQFTDDGNPNSLKRWLSTIMRNQFISGSRKKKEFEDVDDIGAGHLHSAEDQFASLSANQTFEMLQDLDEESRNILLSIADGMTYEEVGEKFNLPIGTIKSRVSRARDKLEAKDTEEAVFRPRVETVDNERYRAVVPLAAIHSTLAPVLPTIEWVDPKTLLIEVTYQRDLTKKSIRFIKRIIKEWDWQKFTVPNCSRLPNGKLVILNGQHTCIAAASHPQINKIPVYISPSGTTLSVRAESFVSLNRDKVAMSSLSLFHANLAAGDFDSLLLQKAVKDAGCYFPREKPIKSRKINQLLNPRVWLTIMARNTGDFVTHMARIVLASKRGNLPKFVLYGIEYILRTPKFSHIEDEHIVEYIKSTTNLDLTIRNFSSEHGVQYDLALAELIARWLATKTQ